MYRREQRDFDSLEAAELYCPNCGMAVPVRKKLLLCLPGAEKYDYLCSRCGRPVGGKEEPLRSDDSAFIFDPRRKN